MKRSIGISAMKIQNAFQLHELGYDPVGVMGFYLSEEIPSEIVKKFPHLHIISGTNHIYSNFYVPNSRLYYLSAGDPDPELECLAEAFTEASLQKMIEILKGDQDEITDPIALECIRFFRMFVTEGPEGALDRIGDEIASRQDHSDSPDASYSARPMRQH